MLAKICTIAEVVYAKFTVGLLKIKHECIMRSKWGMSQLIYSGPLRTGIKGSNWRLYIGTRT